MPSKAKPKYDMEKLGHLLENLLEKTGISVMTDTEKNEIILMDWIQGEKSMYKTSTLILNSDLTYRFPEFLNVPLGKEVADGITLITSTSKENQSKFVTRQHTVYMLQRALSLLYAI